LTAFPVFAAVLVVAALFSFVNQRFIKLPTTIGVMSLALATSVLLTVLKALGLPLAGVAQALIERVPFRETLLNVVLAFLLFAGALEIDLSVLWGEKLTVGLLATIGVLISTAIVTGLTVALGRLLGLPITLPEAALFGALISPTDPIAVLAMLRASRAPKRLEVQIAGESLFNDGVGVVLFFVLAGVAHGHVAGAADVALLLGKQVLGGVGLGLLFGWITYRMLRSVADYQVEVLLTVALATGVYALASALEASGPLAVVVAGLIIGNTGRTHALSPRAVEHLDSFWELIDEFLNVALFTLVGFEVLTIPFGWRFVAAGLLAIPMVLLARWISVGGTLAVLSLRTFPPRAIRILTWGGLRGALAVALALSLEEQLPARSLLLAMTYIVVVFSIIVQGLTFRRVLPPPAGEPAPSPQSP
jgi:CPA1 family monovalent cation:H+ antiporter